MRWNLRGSRSKSSRLRRSRERESGVIPRIYKVLIRTYSGSHTGIGGAGSSVALAIVEFDTAGEAIEAVRQAKRLDNNTTATILNYVVGEKAA